VPVNKKIIMQKEKNHIEKLNKTLTAVCGLYCEACSLFIGTNEDTDRLRRIELWDDLEHIKAFRYEHWLKNR